MRDLIVFALVVLTLPYAFRRPFLGLVVFSWLAYMRPQDLCWGFARSMRLSFFVGVTMVVGWFVSESRTRPFFQRWPRCYLMLALAACVTISLFGAYEVDGIIMQYYVEFLKIIGVAMFTTAQVDTKQRLRMMLWTIAISLGFFGFKGGLWGLLSGGGGTINQGPGGMLGDNNDFALAMVMNLPLLFYLGRSENNLLVRRFCDACFLFSMITVMLTHSRGGFLSMVIVLLLLAWRSGKLFQASIALVIAAVLFVNYAPDHVIERLSTLKQGSQESSAGARVLAWTVALRMIADNPWFGVGLRNFQEGYVRYGAEFVASADDAHVAHNSYLQIWAEAGTFAIVVYLALLVAILRAARRVRRASKRRPDLAWAYSYSRAFEITTIGFLFGSFFLNRGHFDLIYHWAALSGCLLFVFHREVERLALEQKHGTTPTNPAGDTITIVDRGGGPAGGFTRNRQPARGRFGPSGLPRWSRTT